MSKFCSNGHQIEDSWDFCPYCQPTGYAGATPLAKTRIETEVVKPATAAAVATMRKTVLISDRRKAPVVGWLVALSGDQKGEDFRIRDGQSILGTGPDSEILVRDETVSARHASIRYKDGRFFLTDLDSSNGTFLNDGKEAISREELKDNDVIRLGELELKFKCL